MDQLNFWREVRCSLKMLDAAANKESVLLQTPSTAQSEQVHAALMTFIRAIEKQYPELAPPRPPGRTRKSSRAQDTFQ